MLIDVIEIQTLEAYKLKLRFEDVVTGVIDLENFIDLTDVFKHLRDLQYFSQVTINPDLGTNCQPNGADIDPDVLYALVTGKPIPDLSAPAIESIES